MFYWIPVTPPSSIGITVTVVFQLDRKAFPARAVRDGVRVGDPEAAFLQVFAVIEN
jgi:hypothetical protein